jgi:hypothetical protein
VRILKLVAMMRLHVGSRVGWPSIRRAVWVNRFRSAAFAVASRKEEARRSFVELGRAYPELTIGQLRSALPHTPSFRDRVCEGLASLGMRP